MAETDFQRLLFEQIKNSIPPHLSMVDEIAAILELSYDSVYRRIRGEKPITLQELVILSEKFNFSVDQILRRNTDSVQFDAPGLNTHHPEFIQYMKGVLHQFQYFNTFREKEIYYFCKDSTIWNFYLYPEIAAFKTFFWTKTINNHPELNSQTFSYKAYPYTDCFAVGQQVLREFNTIPCVELWNPESMNSTINQIAYYRDAGHFASSYDLDLVIDAFLRMIDHLQKQAERGFKSMPGEGDAAAIAPIKFYINELILGNNNMVIKLNGKSLSMVSYSVLHYLFTQDTRFNSRMMESFNNLLSRSTLVSETGERDRNRFFNAIRQKVKQLHA